MLKTETPSTQHPQLDLYPVEDLVAALVDDQAQALQAVKAASPSISAAVAAMAPRIAAGGRLIYVGAGTSGRLGILDSVELYPTFSWPHQRSVALLAGGLGAMFEAVEGAEDDAGKGASDLRLLYPNYNDVILLVAASGTTPYVLGAMQAARMVGSLAVGIANNAGTPLLASADIGIFLDTGPEVISGSTRLKAGTAQKIVLNTLSSALMVRLHKVYGNLMVDMHPTNAKLTERAVSLTMRVTGADAAAARNALDACQYQIKTAIIMLLKKQSATDAQSLLDHHTGNLRAALQ
ncbi:MULTISPECIES: N-acetylmuramic acid 6-phosphate etherase [unclassified Duganella]|uniref:N-acetylmuramic acid 6-phosphate etherase n=1 Tax=unclassified Duganella TaxID=2636909 RepID=UPI0008905B6B|nr:MULTISPECIES: N-acetylmuramic acid 6-phosphate etherase [unclassified Duganella]SDH27367.1 N-acetylmuramic acid 6-phosphate etherase [Duganella sp. OV458]SDK40489.1 N-acetylmuramic acid 6-phosphate etherase [Duganella sp. OV510]